ncbi:hypothetical protein DC522_29140 [Microvirga sp. KLBC 81]|uniref:hypothetical protein n=1 Tax=Microvirga sp. KLBC 81 TaxID=1862707 RepID=UPI000D52094A|nr:hypothetical protein [Microvirga sp. KLBC 81]PVE20991.1 hypothetical protein DC522_29140 [Microvirga sp. KLBC 81]
MSTAEHDHRTGPDPSDGMIRAAGLRLEKTRMSLERAEKAIARSYQAIERSRELLVGTLGVYPSGAGMPAPAPQTIIIRASTPFVSQPVLDRADEEFRRAELEYGRALLGLSRVWDKLEASLTDDLFREEEAAKAIYDRSVARLREREAQWFALQEALAAEQEAMLLGPPPRTGEPMDELMEQHPCCRGLPISRPVLSSR